MGFRSTLTSEHYAIDWPEWFRKKYKRLVHKDTSVLYTAIEIKPYFYDDLADDIQKVLKKEKFFNYDTDNTFDLVWLHECGGLTKIQISRDSIISGTPEEWSTEDGYSPQFNHSYCYGCSELERGK